MQTPLLASDDDVHGASLSSGPAVNEESEFSRLIAQQQNPLEAWAEGTPPDLNANYALLSNRDGTAATRPHPPRGPLATAVAGTLSLMHLILIWTSYTANVWTESRVRVSVAWQSDYLPLLNDVKEQVLRSTNLVTLLQDLNDSRNYILMFGLWFVSLLLPCAFMILSPTFVLADHVRPLSLAQRARVWNLRGSLETCMRWSLLTFYVVLWISLVTSFLEFQWTSTNIEVGNRARGPLAAYVVGICSAMGLAVLLRSPTNKPSVLQDSIHSSRNDNVANPTSQIAMVRPPPPQAFQDPWRPAAATATDETNEPEDEPTMTLLEDTPERRRPATRRPPSGSSTPELISENQEADESFVPTNSSDLGFGYKFLAFQLGLLSVLLWIPSFYLPVLHLSYGGLATNFLADSVLNLYMWEIASTYWEQGWHFGTPVWILLVVGTVLILTTIVLPLLVTCLGMLAWLGEPKWSTRCYSWLFALQPALGGLVFSLALVGMVHVVTPFSKSVLDQETLGLCQKFNEATGEQCLEIRAQALSGAWFYLVQSFVLELFVMVTLRWA